MQAQQGAVVPGQAEVVPGQAGLVPITYRAAFDISTIIEPIIWIMIIGMMFGMMMPMMKGITGKRD